MSTVLSFENHAPIRVADPKKTVEIASLYYPHVTRVIFTHVYGDKRLFWVDEYSREEPNGPSRLRRTFCKGPEGVKSYFEECSSLGFYNQYVMAKLCPESIIDLDRLGTE